MTLQHPEYLGDAVYAQWDGHRIWLTTSTHDMTAADDRIALNPNLLAALDAYRKRLREVLERQVPLDVASLNEAAESEQP
jgi:hypothetical protein